MKPGLSSGPSSSQVASKKPRGHQAALSLKSGKEITVGRYAPVSEKDEVVLSGNGSVSVRLNGSGKEIPVKPAWKQSMPTDVNGLNLKVEVKEISTPEELAGYKRLTQYHYRGNKGVGRAVPLVAAVSSKELPRVIGFIEITSTLLTNSARRKLFDAKFSDKESKVAWISWNEESIKKFSNTIARISRCVVFPELRGIGLSSVLCQAAVNYCKARWHLAGLEPVFMEITADMLRYRPFVRSTGFQFIGHTEGNADRLIEDMRYLLRKYAAKGRKGLPQGGGGIMSMQISYAETLRRVMGNSGQSLPQLIDVLKKSPDKLSDDEWVALHKVYRRPKPTYILGLTEKAQQFIRERKKKLGIKEPNGQIGLYEHPRRLGEIVIAIERLSIEAPLSGSAHSRSVQESFGFVSKHLLTDIAGEFSFALRPADVCLISGSSGSGKSILLRCLRYLLSGNARRIPNHIDFSAHPTTPKAKCVSFVQPKAGKAPVDQFGAASLGTILKVLAITGLAEPHTYVRAASSLSDGQKYRLGMAMALGQEPDILFVDNFCESLDRFSTLAVCKSLSDATRRFGFRTIVATARPENVVKYLRPTVSVKLTSTDEVIVRRHDTRNQKGHPEKPL